MVIIIDRVMNTLLGSVTRHPAGMHCPSRGDAFVSSSSFRLPRPQRRKRIEISLQSGVTNLLSHLFTNLAMTLTSIMCASLLKMLLRISVFFRFSART